MELIYDNCCDYNGEDSEYFELAEEVRNLFHTFVGIHFEGKVLSEDKPEGKGKKQKRESRSPSACKTPEFTSESSSEEGSDDMGRYVQWNLTYTGPSYLIIQKHQVNDIHDILMIFMRSH